MIRTLFLIPALFFTLIVSSQNAAQWRGENRDGLYNETGLLAKWPTNGPKLLWHYDELGPGHGSAAIANDKIYTSGTTEENGFVIAFDNSGKVIWKTEYGKEWLDSWDGVRTTPVINDGRVYILSGYGLITCMDAESGNILWQVDYMTQFDGQNIKWGVTENLLIYDDQLICTPGGKSANVISLNKNTGHLIWKCAGKGEQSAYGSPALVIHNNKRLVVAQTASSILGIDAENGELYWSHSQANKYSVHPNTPLYYKGQIYVTSGYGQGGVMLKLSENGESVTELWRNESLDNQMGGVVLLDGKIYGSGQASRKWICLDWATGKEIYSSKDYKQGNIISAEGLLYWYSECGDVVLVKPTASAFEMLSSFEVPYGEKQHWAHLVIDSKRLFVRHGTSLMVYDIAQ